MNINKINTSSFGCTFCDVPGKTARESMHEVFEIRRREIKAGYGFGRCPVPGEPKMQNINIKTLISQKAKNFLHSLKNKKV